MTNKYSQLHPDELEEHLANYLIESWSYSKVSNFSRNEKDFEKNYIYMQFGAKSPTTMAGNAYHSALRFYFSSTQKPTLEKMLSAAYRFIDSEKRFEWLLSKTNPTVEKCREQAVKVVTSLINNFMCEAAVYDESIERIIACEQSIREWVCVNGVDVPLPVNAIADLIIETKDGKNVIIDHKSKAIFSSDKERAMTSGKQAITYVLAVEKRFGITIDEVWFIENKHSKNRDGSPQLKCIKVEINPDTRRLYEAMLYEPLKRMIEAVNDPDYIYTINDNDNFVDMVELYDFWAQTMIADIDDFNMPEERKDKLRKRHKKIKDASLGAISPKVISEFRKQASAFITLDYTTSNMSNPQIIEHLLRTFNISVEVTHALEGFSADTYLLDVASGVRINKIFGYKMDIAKALSVPAVRISPDKLTRFQGKSYVAVEVSKKRDRDLIFKSEYVEGLKLPLGLSNYNEPITWNLENKATPHVLVCGATGSGKSVCLRSTIEGAKVACVDRIVIFDPKYEFCELRGDGVSVYNDIDSIEEQMRLLVEEMQARTKNNKRSRIMVIFDEFADAIAQSKTGKALEVWEDVEVGVYKKLVLNERTGEMEQLKKYSKVKVGTLKSLEENLRILLQKGRSLGFNIMVALNRASTKIITGDTKVNLPVQICFRVPKAVDSKVVIDEAGGEDLMGYGDGLIKSPEYPDVVRFQGYFYNAS